MTQDLNPAGSLQPLNVGNVVSAGVVLYRSHLKTYLGIALRGVMWSFLPFLVLLPIAGFLYSLFLSNNTISPITWLLLPVWLGFLVFCSSKYLLHSALVVRLAFKELVSQPETVRDARQRLNTRLWSFFGLACLLSLLLFIVYFGLAIVTGMVTIPIVLVLNAAIGEAATAVIIVLIWVVAIVLGLTWFFSRWFVAEAVLAVEDGVDVGRSVSRSWELTQSSVFRIQGVVLITFLITLPLLALTNYLPSIALIQIEPLSPRYFIVYGISLIASSLGWMVLFPFWQSVKSVLYYDLRNRREGLGLQLRDREEKDKG
jgi:hypothetical protein